MQFYIEEEPNLRLQKKSNNEENQEEMFNERVDIKLRKRLEKTI